MPDLELMERPEVSPDQPRRPGRAALGVVLAVAVVLSLLSYGLVEAASATNLSLYQVIERALNQLSAEIDVSSYGLSSDQVFAVVRQVTDDNPRVVYYDYAHSFLYTDGTLVFSYTESSTEIRRMWAAYDQAVAAILAEVIRPGQSQVEQVMAVHDYLISHISYDTAGTSAENHTAYGALIYRRGVCESYARAMQALLRALEIPSQIVTGVGGGVGHAWNLVQLDGQYFHLDATWDDPVPDVPGRVLHSYFLVPDQVMRKDHSWTGEYPAASSTKYAYLYQQDETLATGGWLYFVDQQEKLGRMLADGSSRQTLTSERVAYLATDGERIYYCNLSDSGYLYKIDVDGNNRRQINSEASRDMRVQDGWIYYYSWDSKTEWRIRPDGTGRAKVNETVKLAQTALVVSSGEPPTQLVCTSSVSADSLTWTSTDPRVAAVSGGQVTPLSPGQTLVQVVTPQGKVADCLVTVLSSAPPVNVIILTIGRAEALVNGEVKRSLQPLT